MTMEELPTEQGLDRAIRELQDRKSEVCAFLEFRNALREHLGLDGQRWERPQCDPPDYWLWTAEERIGVEVTMLRTCQGLFAANARVQKVNEYLAEEGARIAAPPVELLFEPYSASCLPSIPKDSASFDPLWSYLRGGTLAGCHVVDCGFGKVWVTTLPSEAGGGVRVVDQSFFVLPDQASWQSDVNETVCSKVKKYKTPPCRPFWLLLNLKPYLTGSNEAAAFLAADIAIADPDQVSRVFDRVYALTDYIPSPLRGPVCPVRRLL